MNSLLFMPLIVYSLQESLFLYVITINCNRLSWMIP